MLEDNVFQEVMGFIEPILSDSKIKCVTSYKAIRLIRMIATMRRLGESSRSEIVWSAFILDRRRYVGGL